ncbi:MAG: hypothetical protein E6H95_06620, partial [Chloroflexi bacterium]
MTLTQPSPRFATRSKWRRAANSPCAGLAEISTDRALGALYGLAIGDALGMPTQELDGPTARRI